MAKKPRTQVDYNPGQASLQGGVGASEGNYQVSVAPTPKTNAALQFASVINQLPNAAGQLTNYANKVATDRVSQMSDDEILEELSAGDKETFSILKYNKTFNYELVKRKYLMEQQNMANEYDALASDLGNNPDSADIDTAIANMESGLFNKFSGGMTNDLQMQAHKALWNATTTPLKAQAFSKYKALKEEATKMVIESNAMEETFYSGDITNGFKLIKSGLDDLGVPKKEQAQRMMKFSEAFVERLIFEGRFDEAEAVIGQAEAHEFYKGAELGGIAENKLKFLGQRTRIQKIKSSISTEEEEDIKESRTISENLITSIMFNLQDNNDLVDTEKRNIRKLLQKIKPNITAEQEDAVLQVIEGAKDKKKAFQAQFDKVGQTGLNPSGVASDFTARMYGLTVDHISDETYRLSQLNPLRNEGISDAIVEAQRESVKLLFENDPTMSINQMMDRLNYAGLRPPDEWVEIYNEVRKGDWVRSYSYYKNLNSNIADVVKTAKDSFDADDNEELEVAATALENELKATLPSLLRKRAQGLSDKGTEIRETDIREYGDDLIKSEVELFKAIQNSTTIFDSLREPTILTGDLKGPVRKEYFGLFQSSDYEEGTKAEVIENVVAEDLKLQNIYPHLGVISLSDKDFDKRKEKRTGVYGEVDEKESRADIRNKIWSD